MSVIDDVLGEKTTIEEVVADKKPVEANLDLEAMIAKQEEYFRSIQPVEVDVIVSERPTKLFVPFVWPSEFSELSDRHPPRLGVPRDVALWFDLDAVTGAYPGITAVVDGEEDDLIRLRGQEAAYCWPDLYKVLSPEDRQNARMAVWALHVWEPEQQRKAAMAKREGANNG